MANKDEVIGPASNSLSATLGSSMSPKAPTEHKAVEAAEGVGVEPAPSAVIFKRGDVVRDIDKELKVTVIRAYIGRSTSGIPFHEVAHGKSGEKWIQWETYLQKK